MGRLLSPLQWIPSDGEKANDAPQELTRSGVSLEGLVISFYLFFFADDSGFKPLN